MPGKAPIRGESSSPCAKKNINVDAAQFKNTRINNQDIFDQKDTVVTFSGKINTATEIVATHITPSMAILNFTML